MSVYVDAAMIPYGRMKMNHMLADTTEELEAMAKKIGLNQRWIQYPGTYREHYDVCASKRKKAIELGAVEVDTRFLVKLRRKKKETA